MNDTNKTTTTVLAAKKTWLAYAGVLAVLTLAEALVRSEVVIDPVLDIAILVTASPGGGVEWVLSARLILAGVRGRNPLGIAVRIDFVN